MIVLPKINFLHKNIQKQSEAKNAGAQNNPAHIYIYGNFGANLAPLNKDTVTFTAAARRKTQKATREEKDADLGKVRKTPKARSDKKLVNQKDRSSIGLATSLRRDVDFAYKRLKNDISSIFGMLVIDTDDERFSSKYEAELLKNIENKRPVLAVTARKKSARSLTEKMSQLKITTKKDALENISDMIGIRILVSNSDKKSGEHVADRLLKAVKNGWIKISEIEVYRNPALVPASKYDYISERNLDAIAAASRQKVKDFKYVIRQTEFGYSAVHMCVDMPGGVKGEIQIISPRVAAFKEIEDICYKGLSGKEMPKGYAKLKSSFAKLNADREAYDEFAEYTRQAYAKERMKRSKDKGPFLSLSEGSKIPPRLDFNYIAQLKRDIDIAQEEKIVQKRMEEAAEILAGIATEE